MNKMKVKSTQITFRGSRFNVFNGYDSFIVWKYMSIVDTCRSSNGHRDPPITGD